MNKQTADLIRDLGAGLLLAFALWLFLGHPGVCG